MTGTTTLPFRPWLTLVAGAAFGAALYPLWQLEARWFVILVIAVIGISVALMFTARLFDFLFISLLATLPFAAFVKWLAPDRLDRDEFGDVVAGGTAHIGPADFLLLGLYGAWALGLAPARPAAMGRRHWLDVAALLLILAFAVSVIGTPDPALGIGSTLFIVKFVAYYLIISRHFMPRHLPWLLAVIIGSLVFISLLGLFQNFTGLAVGLALDKGAGGAELQTQYQVPGIEYKARATGTSIDSHAFGGFVGMLLMLTLAMALRAGQSRLMLSLLLPVCLLALAALAVSYSRAAYVSFALAVAVVIAAAGWQRQWRTVGLLLAPTLLLVPFAPWLLQPVIERFRSAPWEIMTTRFEQYEVALDVWTAYPLFGFGAGNYGEALRVFNFHGRLEDPVHNALLFLLTETGVFGGACYVAIVAGTLFGYWRLYRAGDAKISWFALGALGAVALHVFDGLTHPLFREPTQFTLFWLLVGVLVALERHAWARRDAARRAAPPPPTAIPGSG